MSIQIQPKNACCQGAAPCSCDGTTALPPALDKMPSEDVCCGPPQGPASSRFERPGYRLCSFVEGFIETAAGPVPQISPKLEPTDLAGSVKVRLGVSRDQYKIAPGLYCIGDAKAASPVLVTANYKLTFDTLRRELDGLDAWILVLDTRGVNVWCAAGKRTFSTEELIQRVKQTHLAEVVSHNELILPQLSATGVSGKQVKKGCGFKVTWGPIRARDIKPFISAGLKADKSMRRVTFAFMERLVLVPVELSILFKHLLWVLLAGFILSGIGSNLFSVRLALGRGPIMIAACIAGIFSGAVLTPLLLPWLPGKAFAIKGLITGTLTVAAFLAWLGPMVTPLETVALMLLITVVSSYLAMNFTGSTPFTSPSGVEKEMRVAIPLQGMALVLAISGWIGSMFV